MRDALCAALVGWPARPGVSAEVPCLLIEGFGVEAVCEPRCTRKAGIFSPKKRTASTLSSPEIEEKRGDPNLKKKKQMQ